MKTDQTTTESTPETTESTVTTPKAPKLPQTSTLTLTANGATLQIVAERKGDGARTYVLTTDAATKKTTRGMTANHPSFEAAKKSIAEQAVKAEKLGWQRKTVVRGFTPKPDAFSSLPAAPAPVAKLVKTAKK